MRILKRILFARGQSNSGIYSRPCSRPHALSPWILPRRVLSLSYVAMRVRKMQNLIAREWRERKDDGVARADRERDEKAAWYAMQQRACRLLSFHRDEGESELNEMEVREERERERKGNGERTENGEILRTSARRRCESAGKKRQRWAPGAKEGRREEWFTCIASIALAQGQGVCETEDQTGSGPPSFQFPAPCSLTALLPLSCFTRHLTSLSFLFRSPPCVSRLNDTQTIASCTRAATFESLLRVWAAFCARM